MNQIHKHLLYNSYNEYVSTPENFDTILNRYTKASISSYSEKEEQIDLDQIIPIIKDKRFILNGMLFMDNFYENHLYEKYNSDLYIFYALDTENSFSYLKRNHLKELNVNLKQLRNLAIDNLYQLIKNISYDTDNGIHQLLADGNLESSLILLDIWNKINFNIKEDIIIGIPTRDLLFVTDSQDLNSIQRLKQRIKELNEKSNYLVSEELFIFKNGQFEVYNEYSSLYEKNYINDILF